MTAFIQTLVLTSIAVAIFTAVMAWGWVTSVEKRLDALMPNSDRDSQRE